MTQVAFATYQKSPNMVDDDRLVADVLQSQGVAVVPAVWDDPTIDWPRYACVVIRSTWDYHHKSSQYEGWLRRCESAGARLWNPPKAVLANMDKRYLAGLGRQGVEVVPSEFLTAASRQPLRQVLENRGWDDVVVKPAVSASAYGTWRTSLKAVDADQARFEEQLGSQDLLVQPYFREVAETGEWSLVFFERRYSHAALKRPAPGDFRVQEHYGGKSAPADPPPALIDQAGEVLTKIDSQLLYARVDGIERFGRFVLMELEINEPYLFVGFSSNGPARFAEAIKAVL